MSDGRYKAINSALESSANEADEEDIITAGKSVANRYVLEWAYLNPTAPPGIHDAAASLLELPSFRPGAMVDGVKQWAAAGSE